MGRDKFGTKRGKCAMCDECFEYTPPADGQALACDYCDHKPIYHVEVVSLGTCGCGKCHGYESSNECQYTSCDYCDCPADKHINFGKIQGEVEKVKLRIKHGNSPVVKSQETTPSHQSRSEIQPAQTSSGNPQYGLQDYTEPPGQTHMPYNSTQGQYTTPLNQQYPPQPTQYPAGQHQQPFSTQSQPSMPFVCPQNQFQGGQMPLTGMPNQFQSGQMPPQMPNQFQSGQMPPQMPSTGMPSQYGPFVPPHQYSPSPSQAFPNMHYPQGGMPMLPGGSHGMSQNLCKKPGCGRPKRQKDDKSGYHDYCGKYCAKN